MRLERRQKLKNKSTRTCNTQKHRALSLSNSNRSNEALMWLWMLGRCCNECMDVWYSSCVFNVLVEGVFIAPTTPTQLLEWSREKRAFLCHTEPYTVPDRYHTGPLSVYCSRESSNLSGAPDRVLVPPDRRHVSKAVGGEDYRWTCQMV
jgi:hypothetical protein